MRRWDAGTYEALITGDDKWEVKILGRSLTGRMLLERMDEANWKVMITNLECGAFPPLLFLPSPPSQA